MAYIGQYIPFAHVSVRAVRQLYVLAAAAHRRSYKIGDAA